MNSNVRSCTIMYIAPRVHGNEYNQVHTQRIAQTESPSDAAPGGTGGYDPRVTYHMNTAFRLVLGLLSAVCGLWFDLFCFWENVFFFGLAFKNNTT